MQSPKFGFHRKPRGSFQVPLHFFFSLTLFIYLFIKVLVVFWSNLTIPFFVLHVFIFMCLSYFLIVLVSFTVFAFLVSFGTKALLVLCIILYEGRLSTSVHIVGSMAISCLSHYFPSLSTNAILLSTTFSFNFFLPLVYDKVMLKHHFCLHLGLRILMLKHDLCQVWAWVCVYIKKLGQRKELRYIGLMSHKNKKKNSFWLGLFFLYQSNFFYTQHIFINSNFTLFYFFFFIPFFFLFFILHSLSWMLAELLLPLWLVLLRYIVVVVGYLLHWVLLSTYTLLQFWFDQHRL